MLRLRSLEFRRVEELSGGKPDATLFGNSGRHYNQEVFLSRMSILQCFDRGPDLNLNPLYVPTKHNSGLTPSAPLATLPRLD